MHCIGCLKEPPVDAKLETVYGKDLVMGMDDLTRSLVCLASRAVMAAIMVYVKN